MERKKKTKSYCRCQRTSLKVSFQEPMHNSEHILRDGNSFCVLVKKNTKLSHTSQALGGGAAMGMSVHDRHQFSQIPTPLQQHAVSATHRCYLSYRCTHAWAQTLWIPFLKGLPDVWPLLPQTLVSSHSWPKPSVSSMANISFSFSCS